MQVTAELSERNKLYHKKYSLENKYKIKEYHKKYHLKHKEEMRLKNLKYRMEHKEQESKRHKIYTKLHRQEHNERKMQRKRNIVIIEKLNRDKLKQMYDDKCVYCDKKLGDNFHIDHLLPVSRYEKIGKKCPHSYDNCVPSCASCNDSKFDKTPLEFLWIKETQRKEEVINV